MRKEGGSGKGERKRNYFWQERHVPGWVLIGALAPASAIAPSFFLRSLYCPFFRRFSYADGPLASAFAPQHPVITITVLVWY